MDSFSTIYTLLSCILRRTDVEGCHQALYNIYLGQVEYILYTYVKTVWREIKLVRE